MADHKSRIALLLGGIMLITVLIACYGCATMTNVLPESVTGAKAKQEAERQAALAEERRQKEQRQQEHQAKIVKISTGQSTIGWKNGEPAIFRKCVGQNGCGNYTLMIPQDVNRDINNPKLLYGQKSIPYDELEGFEVKLAKDVPYLEDFLILEDLRKVQIKCSNYTSYSDGGRTVVQGGVKRCQHITLNELEELKKMIGKTMWVPAPIRIGGVRLSPAHTLKVVDISTDIKSSYDEDYNYLVSIDNKDTLPIPVRTNTLSSNPIKQNWNSNVMNAIKNGEVFLGMTSEQAVLAWGKPSQINKTIFNNLQQEQWVYQKGNYRTDYLYFYNGKLETVQTSN